MLDAHPLAESLRVQFFAMRETQKPDRVGYNLAFGPTVPYYSNVSGKLIHPLPETSGILQYYKPPADEDIFSFSFRLVDALPGDDFVSSLDSGARSDWS